MCLNFGDKIVVQESIKFFINHFRIAYCDGMFQAQIQSQPTTPSKARAMSKIHLSFPLPI